MYLLQKKIVEQQATKPHLLKCNFIHTALSRLHICFTVSFPQWGLDFKLQHFTKKIMDKRQIVLVTLEQSDQG